MIGRYFAGLSLFMFSMTGIVLANNFVMMFIFWELVGVSSYLLIGHWFEKPSAGRATVVERDLTDITPKELTRYYRRDVGFVWQDFTRNLLPYLKAVQNVELPLLLGGIGRRKRRRRALALLEAVGMRG